MSEGERSPFRKWLRNALLDLDSRIDSGMFRLGAFTRRSAAGYSAFMDRFSLSGVPRFFVGMASEGFTLGAAGFVALLALALPAFQETSDDWLKRTELAVTFLDRYGNVLGERGVKQNDTVPLEEIPDTLIKATLATEDRRFYEHFGIDVGGTLRAVVTNARAGGVRQGGSSLSQQLAKNLFLSNERTIERKVKEAFLAMWLESRLTKSQILKLYLDRAYLGGGAYGVDAAARYYFGKSVREVNLAESAMLAGLFKAPTKFAPHINLPAARARASTVLDNLVDAGFMTEGQVFGARRSPATPIDRRDNAVPDYYLDYAFTEVRKFVDTLPKSVNERSFVVRTGLDPNIQLVAEAALDQSLREFGKDYKVNQGAIVIMEPNGTVRAMVGGRDYGESQFNRATDALRQPGSSFKPFVYTTALIGGMRPDSKVVDAPYCNGNWCPQNYGRSYMGTITLKTALQHSLNTVAVRLGDRYGRNKIIDLAHSMGITSELKTSPALPLGAAEVNLVDMATAYSVFANGGKSVYPHAMVEIRIGDGAVLWRFDRDAPKPKQLIPPDIIGMINPMLNNVIENGTGRRSRLENIKVAGKTGTTNAYRDAWFMAFTGNYVGGVWFGNDDYQSMNRMTGGTLPAMTWQKVMAYAHQGIELKTIPGLGNEPAPKLDPPPPPIEVPGLEANERPITLSPKAAADLSRLERLFKEAAPLPAQRPAGPTASVEPAGRAN
ncbi:penicillin-binding protein 1A [Azorhizobium oxalatiphilum]|uniref:Penicillin-binding protein 1A n=1 Tax=Azorhizobium oxalatiphilum TaxID=980631 RepID=A0A917BNH0_9HYPH|nr:PBP1A family penicillin-binding protein [Azorhizobium oxalatiphilum]GGF52970.1 penicillin-binding protein 1A [Azorhizobium oxalatiphilum]